MASILTESLFEKVLIEPSKKADTLFIVSGYATATMAAQHFACLEKLKRKIQINLIVGMTPQGGILETNHKGFVNLMDGKFKKNFSCSYVNKPPPVHSKLYGWFEGKNPICGFMGSANYSQKAFGKNQHECLIDCDPNNILKYYEVLSPNSLFCNILEAEKFCTKYSPEKGMDPTEDSEKSEFKRTVRLYEKATGKVPARSGLNWGQRLEYVKKTKSYRKRNPNQAYISLPSEIYKSSFFPERGIGFTISTDDDQIILCGRAQDNGKAIHSTQNNSEMGEYFRNRLGLKSGQFITIGHLEKYGRKDVTFTKIDDENYLMDFSVS